MHGECMPCPCNATSTKDYLILLHAIGCARKYLDMPLSFTTLKTFVWDFLEGKYLKRFEAWMGQCNLHGEGDILFLIPL